MSEPPFRTVTIYGPGLLGGSVALAVRDNLPGCELRLWARREQPLQLANSLGIIHLINGLLCVIPASIVYVVVTLLTQPKEEAAAK